MNDIMSPLFYELIQVAIGTRSELSRVPSASEWMTLYELSDKQAVVGICFAGAQRIYNEHREQTVCLPKDWRMLWLGRTVQLEDRNRWLNKQCSVVQQQFREAGLNTCILKGQGVASYYSPELSAYRQSGDIDLWVDATWKEVMDYVNARTPNREFDMKHTHLELFRDTIVEVHWWPSMPVNPFYRKALHAYYRGQAPIQCAHKITLRDGTEITAPEAKFEAVHVLYHIFNHFLYEGIGLRQMMDLYFVLVNGGMTNQDRADLLQTYKNVGLGTIAPATMWVLCEVFGMDEKYSIGGKDEKLGQVFMREIEEGGNFGTHSEENRVYNESFAQRMKRRMKRRIRLFRYNPWGVVTSPLTKVKILLWKRKVIKLYNL